MSPWIQCKVLKRQEACHIAFTNATLLGYSVLCSSTWAAAEHFGVARTCQLGFLAGWGVARLQSTQAKASAPMLSLQWLPLQLACDSHDDYNTETLAQQEQQLLPV